MLARARDAFLQTSAVVVLLGGVVLVALGGYALWGVTARYGLVGTVLSIFLLAVWAMFAVPFVMAAQSLRERGSRRRRDALAVRRAADVARYGRAGGASSTAPTKRSSAGTSDGISSARSDTR